MTERYPHRERAHYVRRSEDSGSGLMQRMTRHLRACLSVTAHRTRFSDFSIAVERLLRVVLRVRLAAAGVSAVGHALWAVGSSGWMLLISRRRMGLLPLDDDGGRYSLKLGGRVPADH